VVKAPQEKPFKNYEDKGFGAELFGI